MEPHEVEVGIEQAECEAVYCPVLERGKWNATMARLHQADKGLARKWQTTKRRPVAGTTPRGLRTRVLALRETAGRRRTVLYAAEENGPGSGIAAAARYAERAGFKQLGIDGSGASGLKSDEGRGAVARTASTCGTELVVHLS